MSIEFVSKAKVESLMSFMPQVVSKVLLAPETACYILISDEKVLSTYFVVAIVVDGEIDWISDNDYREKVLSFIKETK